VEWLKVKALSSSPSTEKRKEAPKTLVKHTSGCDCEAFPERIN
jgi:hypothetical protein